MLTRLLAPRRRLTPGPSVTPARIGGRLQSKHRVQARLLDHGGLPLSYLPALTLKAQMALLLCVPGLRVDGDEGGQLRWSRRGHCLPLRKHSSAEEGEISVAF